MTLDAKKDVVFVPPNVGDPKIFYGVFTDYDTAYTYDGSGNITVIQHTLETVLRIRQDFTYDGSGNITEIRTRIYEQDGVTVKYDYTDAYTYDGSGNITDRERTVA